MFGRKSKKYDLIGILKEQFKNRKFSKRELELSVSFYPEAVNRVNAVLDVEEYWDNPAEHLLNHYFNSIDVLNKFCSAFKPLVVINTNEITPKTSYAINADGNIYICDVYNHIGFYLNYALHNDKDMFLNFVIGGENHIMYEAIESIGFVEFSCDGCNNFNVIRGNSKYTKKQKEALFKMYEINNIVERYFTEIEGLS